jgi:quercetin dioxygenase-like cupin family protein
MKTLPLLQTLEFRDDRPLAKPLLVDESGRVLRFTLRPNQRVAEHCAPHSPVHIVVLSGKGVFTGADGREVLLGPDALVVFNAGERHTVRALDEELVFVAFLHRLEGVPVPKHRAKPKADTYLTWFM